MASAHYLACFLLRPKLEAFAAGGDGEPNTVAASGLPPMPGMDTPEGANLAAQMQDALHNLAGNSAQQLAPPPQNTQYAVPLPYMLHPGSLMQMSPGTHQEPPEGSALPPEGVSVDGGVASSNANLLKLFAAACQQKGIVTRTQRSEMEAFVRQMYLERISE